MFVIKATVGRRLWKLRSNSHASATNARPVPLWLPVPPSCGAVPPTTKLGSNPHCSRAWAIIAVVVDLPCVPATATPSRSCMICPSSSAYFTTRKPYRQAARYSALVSLIAAVRTTRSVSAERSSPCCPREIRAPRRPSSVVCSLGVGSEPETTAPQSIRMRASPFIPDPPIPIKCTCLPANRLGRVDEDGPDAHDDDDAPPASARESIRDSVRTCSMVEVMVHARGRIGQGGTGMPRQCGAARHRGYRPFRAGAEKRRVPHDGRVLPAPIDGWQRSR